LLNKVRDAVDAAERLVESTLWPMPNYEELCYGTHFESA